MPTTVRVTNDTSKCVYTSGSTTLSIAQNSTEGTSNNPLGDYAVGNHIEFNMDGVVRTVTAVDTVNITITFTPGLHGPTVGDGLAWVSLPRYDFVENWGTRTNFARDSRLSGTSQGLTMSGTGGPIGSLLIIPNYQADDFDGDGFRDVPILPADVQTNLNAHDFHTATWLSYGTY